MTLAKNMQVLQTPTFKKAVKKLHANQKNDLDKAIKSLIKEPLLGEQKKVISRFFEYINSKWQSNSHFLDTAIRKTKLNLNL